MKIKYFFMAMVLALPMVLTSCGDDDDAPNPFKDAVITVAATNVTECDATLSGVIDMNLIGENVSEFGLLYSSSPNFLSEEAYNALSFSADKLSEDGYFAFNIPDLSYDTPYYFAAFAKLKDEKVLYGAIRNFRTKNYVDFGLKSGTLWGCYNIEASMPKDAGGYYAWGEKESKSNYSWDTYLYGKKDALTKYNFKSNLGIVDDLKELDVADDVVYNHPNFGKEWRIPSKEQFEELIDQQYTTFKIQKKDYSVIVDGEYGVETKLFLHIEKKNDPKHYIDLVAAGSHQNKNFFYNELKTNGIYWTRSLYYEKPDNSNADVNAYVFTFGENDNPKLLTFARCYGHVIRPVKMKK